MDKLRLFALLKESLRVSRQTVNHGFLTFRDELEEAYEIIEKLYQQLRDEEGKRAHTNGGEDVKN